MAGCADSPRVDFDESVRAFLRKYSWDAHTSKHLKYLEIPAYDLEQGLAVDESCHITDQKVSDAEATCLAKALQLMEPENLKSIHLTNNNIGDEGAMALAAAVASVPHLETLFLAGNHIGDAGLAAIADRCASTPLSQLVLSENAALGDEGAIALARAVTSDPSSSFASLQWLYLDSSAISDKGVDALAKALVTGMKRLERLALQNCKLTNKGLASLAAAIEQGALPRGQFLYVQQNNFDNSGKALLKAAARPRHIKVQFGWPPPRPGVDYD